MATIQELVAGIEIELEAERKREAKARKAIEAVLEAAQQEGRSALTEEEDKTCEHHFEVIELAKDRQEAIKVKLARAKKVEAEEAESDARMNSSRPTAAAAKRNGGSDYSQSVTPRVSVRDRGDGHPTMDIDYQVSGTEATPEWTRASDGRPAAVARGQRFADHEVNREIIARNEARDRHIVEAHGSFGQYLRAMTTTGASAIVPTVWSAQVIDLARNAAVMFQAGARLVPMDAKIIQIGRLTQDPAPVFKTEGSPVTAGDMAYDYIQLTATSLSALVVTSLEFLQDAPNSSELIQSALGKAMGLELDRAAIFGQLGATGTNDEGAAYGLAAPYPKGILKALTDYNSGSQIVGSFPANGTAQTAATPWDEMLSLVYKPLRANERVSAIISNVALDQQYASMYDSLYNPIRKPDIIAGLPWLKTNAIPSYTRGTMTNRATDVFAGDFSQVLIGQRLGLEIRILTERYAESGQVGLLAYFRGDVQIARPKALACYRALQGAA